MRHLVFTGTAVFLAFSGSAFGQNVLLFRPVAVEETAKTVLPGKTLELKTIKYGSVFQVSSKNQAVLKIIAETASAGKKYLGETPYSFISKKDIRLAFLLNGRPIADAKITVTNIGNKSFTIRSNGGDVVKNICVKRESDPESRLNELVAQDYDKEVSAKLDALRASGIPKRKYVKYDPENPEKAYECGHFTYDALSYLQKQKDADGKQKFNVQAVFYKTKFGKSKGHVVLHNTDKSIYLEPQNGKIIDSEKDEFGPINVKTVVKVLTTPHELAEALKESGPKYNNIKEE